MEEDTDEVLDGESLTEARSFYLGIEYENVKDLKSEIEFFQRNEVDFVVVPLIRENYARDSFIDVKKRSSSFVGKLEMKNVNLPHNSNSLITIRQSFFSQLEWANYLSIIVLLPAPELEFQIYAQMVKEALEKYPNMIFWTKVNDWDNWNRFRTLCDYHPNVLAALNFESNIPDYRNLKRWEGEPIKAIFLSFEYYKKMNSEYKYRQNMRDLIKNLAKFDPRIVLFQQNLTENEFSTYIGRFVNDSVNYYLDGVPNNKVDQLEGSLLDEILDPVQPLMDNLSSRTYEGFERDEVKYKKYEDALYRAIKSFFSKREEIVVIVVGAGRGPLVQRASNAIKRAGMIHRVRIIAVEKNPSAVAILNQRKKDDLNNVNFTIVESDIRDWNPGKIADIIVSELLGSFSDNELSPECLREPETLVLKDGGIMIPSSYASFLSPISSSHLYNQVRNLKNEKYMNSMFVVRMHNFYKVAPSQVCFEFTHPSKKDISAEYKNINFKINENAIIHGFAGYLSTVLYGDVTLSTRPEDHTPDMYSWFPMFIPLKNPITVHAGQILSVNFWRNKHNRKVWYEWSITQPIVTEIQNSGGKYSWAGL